MGVRQREAGSAGFSLAGLVGLLTLMTLELVRSSGPLLDLAYSRGLTAVVEAALITYLAPGPVALLVLLVARRRSPGSAASALLVGTSLLAGLRLVVQALESEARFAVGLLTVVVAVAVLTLAVAILAGRPGGGWTAAGAVSAGAAAGVGLQLALDTWDAYWRHTPLGWSVTVAVVGCLVWLAVLAMRDPATAPTRQVGRLWALGPYLALAAMMLANPAFAASQSGVPLALAGPLNALGLLIASWTATRSSRRLSTSRLSGVWTLLFSPLAETGILVLLVGGALSLGGLVAFDGVLVLLALLGAQVTALSLLGRALDPAALTQADRRLESGIVSPRGAAAASLVGLGTIVPLLVYQIDYDVPLGFPNELVLMATAAVLGASALRRSGKDARVGAEGARPVPWIVFAGCSALVLVGAVIAGAAWVGSRRDGVPGATERTAGSSVVVSWNLHYGVSPAGSVDLETTARTIAAHNPDVVLLQEVSRGWVLGGGVDMATWLSNRLGRQFAFAPAADRRFGNVIMSRAEPVDVEIQSLPYGDGPQNRSALSATVPIGTRTIRATSLHLQHRQANTPTRMRELESFLSGSGAVDPSGAAIVGGDLNAGPGTPEIALMTGAGFVSAVDVAGDPTALTSPTTGPTRRIDWVFGKGVGFLGAKVLVSARSSDHLPLVVALAP